MKKIREVAARLMLTLALIASTVPALATMQARDDAGTTITLLETPCLNADALAELPRLNQILKDAQITVTADQLHAGSVFYKGRNFGACWVLLGQMVVILDDGKADTSIFPVPVQAFRNHEGV